MLEQLRQLIRRPFKHRRKSAPEETEPRIDLAARYPDFSDSTLDVILEVEPYTMTSPERIESLCSAVQYLSANNFPGDIVECGVWRGGSMMAVARTLQRLGDSQRMLHLYDTYEGMPPADEVDRDFLDADANQLLNEQNKDDPKSIWCYSGLQEVKQNMSSTGYDSNRIRYIKGKVEETLVSSLPESIALLRLDTDWYESTRVCLEQLYPRLEPGGILIIDDYGHWQGCKKAVDEYFAKQPIAIHLQRIDYTGRLAVKPGEPVGTLQKASA